MTDKREYFEFNATHDAVWRAVEEVIRRITTRMRGTVLNPENEYEYHHGIGWTYHTSEQGHRKGDFTQLSHTGEIKFADVAEHKIERVPEYIHEMCSGMHRIFMENLYRTVGDAVEEIGNVVSTKKAGSPAKAFLEMLQKIEFGVDRAGQVSLPELHGGKEVQEALIRDLKLQGDEFQKLVKKVTAEKTQRALEREEERKARFKRRSEEDQVT